MPSGVYLHKKTQGMFGKKHTKETLEKMKIAQGNMSEKTKKNMRLAKKKEYQNGRVSPFKRLWKENPNFLRGENSPRWIKDRTKVKGIQERNNPEYKQWVKEVKKRDNNTCRINNKDCSGYCIVHHILSWRDYPELRYEINNGITLCQAHHPRKRAEEKRLIPIFEKLVSVSSV